MSEARVARKGPFPFEAGSGTMYAWRRRRRAAALALLALASACGVLRDEEAGPACPQLGILRDAADLARFDPEPSREITNMVLEAEIVAARGACAYERDEGRMVIDLEVTMEATRGPASPDRGASVPYFVALADREGNILNKRTFEVGLVFPPNRSRVRMRDDMIRLTVPLGSDQTGADFEIYLGFQLTREELEYNRSRSRL